jgi:hypothetical protein
MRKGLLVAFAVGSTMLTPAIERADDGNTKPAAGAIKLPDNWGDRITVKDLMDEISESAGRMGQNLKKPSDFDKFLKSINSEGHLTAILGGLVQEHPQAGGHKATGAQLQEFGLAVAKAAEAKGAKNLKTAQEAHKKILELIKKAESPERGGAGKADASPDWASLGALGDVMKRVEPSYKYVRGKMSNEAAFKKECEAIRHSAAMLYVFGHISPAFRPTESDMPKLSDAMSTAAEQLLDAVKTADFAKASEANTAINAACNECHKVKRFQKKGSDFDF